MIGPEAPYHANSLCYHVYQDTFWNPGSLVAELFVRLAGRKQMQRSVESEYLPNECSDVG